MDKAFEVVCSGRVDATPAEPCLLAIFGATGDICQREVLPALLQLGRAGLLPDPFAIIGIGRRKVSDESLRQQSRETMEQQQPDVSTQDLDAFLSRLSYLKADEIAKIKERDDFLPNILIHLAIPPDAHGKTVEAIKESAVAEVCGWRRLIVEKPFGRDEKSAHTLNETIQTVFDEEEVYRIDHYLGKETVQNMLVFRFANPAFEPIWNRNFIDHVQIIVDEQIGIGNRGTFYEETGVARDMLQNHLLQLLCMVALEPLPRFEASCMHSETLKVLECVRPSDPNHCVWGQYSSGSIAGKKVAGYRQEEGVELDSTMPTFIAAQLFIDNWRWAGVPFYVRTGKRLKEKLAQVTVRFKPVPHLMLPIEADDSLLASSLSFRIQPREGIHYDFVAKQPGMDTCLSSVRMNFRYSEAFEGHDSPSPYQSLLFDALRGDQTLFPSSDWVLRAWTIVDPMIQAYESATTGKLASYEAGSTGPAEARTMMMRDGRQWTLLSD